MTNCVKTWGWVPYGGVWWFVYPDTGVTITARHRDGIMKLAKQHAEDHNLPVGVEFEAHVEDWICAAMPQECGPCLDGQIIRNPMPSPGAVIQGLNLWVKLKFRDYSKPTLEEARSRAAACFACPRKTQLPGGCGGGCGGIQALANSAFEAMATGYNLDKMTCSICECYVSAAVSVNLQAQQSVLTEQQKQDFREWAKQYPCWKAVGL